MEFIECLVKKMGEWTQSGEGAKVLHDIFVSLSKISPEVFLDNWKDNRDLHPSPEATLAIFPQAIHEIASILPQIYDLWNQCWCIEISSFHKAF